MSLHLSLVLPFAWSDPIWLVVVVIVDIIVIMQQQ